MTQTGMYVLCTGGLGYIGTHTALQLLDRGYKVAIVDNCSNASPVVLKRLAKIRGVHEDKWETVVKFFKVDLATEAEKTKEIFAAEKFDAVIHFAGLKAVGESCSMPLEYYENNLMSTINLLKVMREVNCKKIVFSSSATVYQPSEKPLDEESLLGASNPYGYTKQYIEQFLKDLYTSDKTWAISILRYFNPVGAHPSGLIGENPLGHPNNLMPFIQQVGVGKRPELTVFGDDYNTPDGTGVRDYIHVDDLSEGHLLALDYISKQGQGCFVHNLGSGKGFSVLEMVKGFEAASGVKIAYKVGPRRPGDLATVIANPAKAEKDFGFKTKRNIEEIMVSAWKWQSGNPEGYPKE